MKYMLLFISAMVFSYMNLKYGYLEPKTILLGATIGIIIGSVVVVSSLFYLRSRVGSWKTALIIARLYR